MTRRVDLDTATRAARCLRAERRAPPSPRSGGSSAGARDCSASRPRAEEADDPKQEIAIDHRIMGLYDPVDDYERIDALKKEIKEHEQEIEEKEQKERGETLHGNWGLSAKASRARMSKRAFACGVVSRSRNSRKRICLRSCFIAS